MAPLDLNPEALTPSGMAHLCDMLQHIFGVPWPTWRFARVSRVDVAIDLWGVVLTDWVWDLPKRTAREVICRQREVRTVYLGAKRASPLVIYNKGKQNPDMAAGGALTRVEYRAKYTGLVLDLLTLVNPLREVIVFDPTKLAYADPHRAALRAVGHLHGLKGIVRTFPDSQRKVIEHRLTEAKAVWWQPLKIWDHWSECLRTTLPILFEGQTAESAAAYLLAMKLQAGPVTGEPSALALQGLPPPFHRVLRAIGHDFAGRKNAEPTGSSLQGSTWTKPASASAARRSGCTSPRPCCSLSIVCRPGAAACWPTSRASTMI